MDFVHHVIPRHEWKVRFGNLEGFNAPDNKVRLSREQHSHVHFLLYEITGNPYDLLASKAISGQCSMSDASKEAERIGTMIGARLGGLSRKGYVMSGETKEKIRIAKTGIKQSNEHRLAAAKARTGIKHPIRTPEQNRQNSERQRNSPKAQTHVSLLNSMSRGRPIGKSAIISCPHCEKSGGARGMKVWHFDKCKHINSHD